MCKQMKKDRRVIKTKKNLKNTFMNLLLSKPFDKITIKELCESSETSRITFYVHYKDKYDLIEDISKDMVNSAKIEYQRLQSENNLEKDSIKSYCNFLDCVLNVYYDNFEFFSHISSYENPYLNFSLYEYILKYLKIHTQRRSDFLKPKYSLRKIAGFLCYGCLGFIKESNDEKSSKEIVRKELREILKKILECEVLTENFSNDLF